MKRNSISLFALIAATAASGMAAPARAQAIEDDDGTILLDTISVTASTEAVPLGRTGSTVDVVSEQDLVRGGNLSLAAQLARLPGVSMARSGGIGTATALRIRGLSGPYIGVRIDGIDVSDPSGTQCAFDFGSTTSGGISRIEVLRGSQSALFGSEAVGGVVDITTFRPETEGTSGQVSVEAGSNNTYAGTASVGLKTERTELAFSLSRTTTDGISAYAFGTEDDAFRSTNLSFYAAHDLTDTLRIGINGFARDSYSEFDSQTADNAQTEDATLRGGRIFLEAQTGAVAHEVSLSRTEVSRYYPLGFTKLFDGDRNQLAYKGRWDALDTLSVNWGLDRTRESFGSDAERGQSTTTSALVEVLYAPTADLDLSVALRRDDHDVFGGKTSGRVALAWRPNESWVIRAVAGTGFRAPSLYELYGAYGNTGLTPETSRSFELGAEYIRDAGSVQVTLFDTRFDNKIGFDGASMACTAAIGSGWPGCYAQVAGETATRGVEVKGAYQIGDALSVFGNYTYTDAFSTSAGVDTRLVRVPRHDLSIGVDYQFAERWSGSASVQHVADFLDNGIYPAPVSAMPDYTVVNLSVTHDVTDTAQAYLRVENVFNEEYQTVRNYGQPGRQVFAGIRAKF